MVLALIDRACRHIYVLALLMAALTFALMPLHTFGTQHANVTRAIDERTAEARTADLPGAEPGDRLQIYRFNNDWMREIGFAEVTEVRDDKVLLAFDPAAMAWPMGVQGSVVDVQGRDLVLNIGSNQGVRSGQMLHLFADRQRVGRVRVTASSSDTSRAELLQWLDQAGRVTEPEVAMGLQVTPYVVCNQVTRLGWGWVAPLEWAAIAGMLALWIATIVSPNPGRWLEGVGARFRRGIADLPEGARRAGLIALGVPACFVALQIAGYFWVAFPQLFWNDLRAVQDYIGFLPTRSLRATLPLPDDLRDLPPILAIAGFVAWVAMVLFAGRNPLVPVLEFVRFCREKAVIYRLFAWVKERGTLNWLLHWVVFYLFARNLQVFLKANMKAASQVGWARHQLPFDTWAQWAESSWFMLTTWPDMAHWMQWFEAARYLTWSACICGCFIGYGHTLLSILWKKEAIHWVDFTATGWLANLMCYGAYANAVFRVFPHAGGVDPSVTEGPLVWFMLVTELFLNLVYTASIFNMGTKFGVMVDKGLVDRGFYSVVRHPSYTLEPLMFSILFLNRVTTPIAVVALFAHPFMYWVRSERDDHFMGEANPDYPPYRERVKYKFVPGLW